MQKARVSRKTVFPFLMTMVTKRKFPQKVWRKYGKGPAKALFYFITSSCKMHKDFFMTRLS